MLPALRSPRLATRLLVLFVISALGPVALVAWLAMDEMTSELRAQSGRRLHAASKASGMLVVERLFELDRAFRASGAGPEEPPAGFVDSWRQDANEASPALADPGGAAPFSPRERAHLRSGGTLLRTHASEDDRARVFLVRAATPGQLESLRIGELDTARLAELSHEDTLPSLTRYCILDARGRPIASTLPEDAPLPSPAGIASRGDTSGSFDWQVHGEDHFGRYWSLFVEPNFLAGTWTVILLEPMAQTLAPVTRFRRTFGSAVVAGLLLAGLLTSRQIRRRLRPLERLRAGAQRIAVQDFSARLDVESGDEFEELARSFNFMASRLSEQFDALTGMVAVDRAILSVLDLPALIETTLSKLPTLYACDGLLFLVNPPDELGESQMHVATTPGRPAEVTYGPILTREQTSWLAAEPEHREIPIDGSVPFLAPLRKAGAETAVVLPLFAMGRVAGVIACGHRAGQSPGAHRIVVARQIADQVSMALANVFTVEENRVLAYYDALTGMPNRLLFKERAEHVLGLARRHREQAAVCMLDLDGFKRVNDTLGHDAGDRLLQEVSGRLARVLRSGTLARLGGDEFAIVLGELSSPEDPARVAERVVDEFAGAFVIDEREIFITTSMGIAVYPLDGTHLDTLTRNADTAMYDAKASGGNSFRFYTPEMHRSALARLTLETQLRHAVARGELRCAFQPIVDAATREIVAAEALVRWQHPDRGLVPPAEFVPLAEETGLILEIGEWMMDAACQQVRAWRERGLSLRVCVNLSGHQLQDEALIARIQRAIDGAGIPPQLVTLELTESTLIGADERPRRALADLRDLGLTLTIDDFGTGYSSLSYLKHLNVDQLKIDRSFIRGVPGHAADAAIVAAIVAMAEALGLGIVAEGVEREDQLAFLQRLGCPQAQGHLFSEPLLPDAFDKLLRDEQGE